MPMPGTDIQHKQLLRAGVSVLLGRTLRRRFRMMSQRHIAGGAAGTRAVCCTLLITVLLAGTIPASAQSSHAPAQPDLGASVGAFLTARQWINDFAVPPTDHDDANIAIENAHGIYIALRHNGRVVGTGIDTTSDALSLRKATGRALSELLGDESMRNTPETLRNTVGAKLNLELEIAGPLRPMIARTAEHVAQHYEPGLDGLAMRRGEALAMLFPAQMRRSGNADNIDAAIARLAAMLKLKPAPLDELINQRKVSVYRFRTVHLVQDQPEASPTATHRGLRLVSTAEVTRESIRQFADAAAAHLINKLWTGDEPLGLLGDYDPLRDDYQPMFATPRDQALAAVAIAKYANINSWDYDVASAAHKAAHKIILDLSEVTDGEHDPFEDIATCALILAGLVSPERMMPFDRTTTNIMNRALVPLQIFKTLEGEQLHDALSDVTPTTRGMIAYALLQQEARSDDTFDWTASQRVARASLETTDESARLGPMTWAYQVHYFFQSNIRSRGEQPVLSLEELTRMRLALWHRQIKHAHAPRFNDPDNTDWLDLTGGFALDANPNAARVRPNAQSARVVALLALMLNDDVLSTDATRGIAQKNQLLAMRYLMQLQITEADAWGFRNPDRALGGIRSNTWSAELATAATAMALIAAVDTLRAIESLQTRKQQRAAPENSQQPPANVREQAPTRD